MNKKTICFLKGEKVFLRPIEIKELPKIASLIEKWVNDEVITYYMFTGQRPRNAQQIISDFKKQIEEENNVILLIVDLKTKKPIGYAGLHDINFIARKAEIRVVIGEKDFWGKGRGAEAMDLITYYGFDRLNLNRIYSGYTAENKGAARMNEKAGYRYEGILKEDIYRNGRYYDSIRVAILRKDYYKKFYKSHTERFGQEFSKK